MPKPTQNQSPSTSLTKEQMLANLEWAAKRLQNSPPGDETKEAERSRLIGNLKKLAAHFRQ